MVIQTLRAEKLSGLKKQCAQKIKTRETFPGNNLQSLFTGLNQQKRQIKKPPTRLPSTKNIKKNYRTPLPSNTNSKKKKPTNYRCYRLPSNRLQTYKKEPAAPPRPTTVQE